MANGETQGTSNPQSGRTYEFLQEFERRNSLIDALKFAISGQCQCEACQKLRIAAEVLEEDRKKGERSPLI